MRGNVYKQEKNNTIMLNPKNFENFDNALVPPMLFIHVYILAMSGMGKTEIMKILILRFYLEKMSNIIILDLNGDLSRQIARVVTNKKDIVYIDMMSTKKFTPIHNPLRTKHRDTASLSI